MRYTTTVDSPVGRLVLVSDGAALTAIRFDARHGGPRPSGACVADDRAAPFPQARQELAAYFAGRLTAFTIPLAPAGTPFQRRVWEALRRIPYGATASYRQVAADIGSPKAARAVGAANARNPLPIVVPCHRVIASDGTLSGYGGGVGRKKALLGLESARPAGPS